MNSHDLARQLLALPDMPVVIEQDNDPQSGVYSAAGVELRRMRRDGVWSDPEGWDFASAHRPDDRDTDVCLLTFQEPATNVVDTQVVREPLVVMCPSCGNRLEADPVTAHGDGATVTCRRCQQIHVVKVGTTVMREGGPGWREIIAEHARAVEDFDRDTRTLATADRAHAELHADDPVCFLCGGAITDEFCGRCRQVTGKVRHG